MVILAHCGQSVARWTSIPVIAVDLPWDVSDRVVVTGKRVVSSLGFSLLLAAALHRNEEATLLPVEGLMRAMAIE